MTKEEIIIYLTNLSRDELSYTLGRYCGPGNRILAEKKFGRSIDKLVNQEIIERCILGTGDDNDAD